MVAAAFVAAPVGADPLPARTAAPLREIGRERVSADCDAIRWPIAPVVLALAKNDELIAAGRRATVKLRDDATARARGRVEFDERYLDQIARLMLHNSNLVTHLLAAKRRDPAIAADATSIERDLPRVQKEQLRILDLIEGFVATDDLGQMQHDLPAGVGPVQPGNLTMPTERPDTGSGFVGDAGLPKGPSDIGLPGAKSPDQLAFDARSYADGAVSGHTVYDLLARSIDAQRAVVANAWVAPTATIQKVVPACRPAPTSPAPAASVSP